MFELIKALLWPIPPKGVCQFCAVKLPEDKDICMDCYWHWAIK